MAEDIPTRRLAEKDAVREFLETHFGTADPDFRWRLRRRLADHTHVHLWFELTYREVPVAERMLKLHYHRGGWIESASSNWEAPFRVVRLPHVRQAHALETRYRSRYTGRSRRPPYVRGQPVIWVRAPGDAVGAVAVDVSVAERGRVSRLFLEADTGRVLWEQDRARRLQVAGQKVYAISPLQDPTDFLTVTIDGLANLDSLRNDRFHVRREQDTSDPTFVDIDPETIFADEVGFESDPDLYDFDCTGAAEECPNQGFEGINVYYHLQQYRNWVEGYFSQLGLNADQVLAYDPLDVVVNMFSLDDNLNGEFDDANNAFYSDIPCDEGGASAKRACLIFFRPEAIEPNPLCGNQPAQFYHLAREALVISHEYQHYVTDMMTGLVRGSVLANVGDALHEGYSDYFGSSYVTQTSGVATTVLGEYAFQECSGLLRDVAVLTPFENTLDFSDPHVAGLTWASALWYLRSTLGAAATDRLALKSMTFLPVDAGFVEAVEALVQADVALFAGEHVVPIRELLYGTLRFSGVGRFRFRDAERGVVEVGFQSCAGASAGAAGAGGGSALGLMVLWLALTLGVGRGMRRGGGQ